MPMKDVGIPDPELKTSPVINPESLEDGLLSNEDTVDSPICYLNGKEFGPGSYVRSGNSVLRCEQGVWKMIPSEDETQYV